MINEKYNSFRLKESIINLSDTERDRLIKNGKKIGQNERQSLQLKTDV